MDIREQELEQRLRTAMDHAAPDALDRILASCEAQKGIVIPMEQARKPRRRRWASLAVAAALAVVCCVFGLTSWRGANAVASVVSLDVNPSIQLQVSKNENVLSAEALNEDARVILDGMDLKGTQLKVAVNAIVGSLLQNGYLDRLSSAILISVEDDDAQRAARLESDLTAEVGTALENASAGAAILSQILSMDTGLQAQAQSSSISVGKAAMIRDIQALNSQLDFDALSALSVEELKQLRETGAPDMPIGTAAAAAAAMQYAGVSSSAVTYDVDPELDEYPAYYEVELYTASGEFDYNVDAWTGQVLKGPANVSSITGTTTPSGISGGISADKAKSIALADAGVSESSALGLRVKQDWDDGMAIYEVEFRCNGAEYEYDIRSSDGAILKSERDDDNDYYYTTAPSASGSLVGEAAAQSAALTHAGVKESDTSYLSCHLEYDDGRVECYEVEFQAGSTQYEYEIGPYDGAVWKAERETRAAVPASGTTTGTSGTTTGSTSGTTSGSSSLISAEAAKSAALAHAGVNASNVYEFKCELDRDDGVTLYEVEFKSGGMEYEYEIDATTGAVLKAEQDWDD
ncbi:PepSY domain-containing protein [Dysosmobacter sp.]|uniref:PepSY domain-containing protein n=1 Tax=Dysosmobacter sp. TaxID=2591382 RepID=UPI003A928864